MADDILRCANQVGSVEATDFYEGVIAVSDDSSSICCRDEFLLRCKRDLTLRNGLVVPHSCSSLGPVKKPSADARKM
jgi:hypothetical protein